ncbi:MAG: hypothetical protein WC454_00400 [Phycisphaerae bacterium]|jgi:hypothetical protein
MNDRKTDYGRYVSEIPEEVTNIPESDTGEKDKSDVQITKEKVLELIRAGRRAGYRYAADNLEHWLTGKGQKLVMPASAFTAEQFFIRHLLDVHLPRFAGGVEKRLKSGVLALGGSLQMTWAGLAVAPEDSQLWLALGGFNVASSVLVSVVELPGDPTSALIRFELWIVKCSDYYNWDKNKETFVQLFGTVTDEEMIKLETAGIGQSYPIESRPLDVLNEVGRTEVAVPR